MDNKKEESKRRSLPLAKKVWRRFFFFIFFVKFYLFMKQQCFPFRIDGNNICEAKEWKICEPRTFIVVFIAFYSSKNLLNVSVTDQGQNSIPFFKQHSLSFLSNMLLVTTHRFLLIWISLRMEQKTFLWSLPTIPFYHHILANK
jgi:hypothetical protein